ncbi:MAG: hypothetical protein NTY99_02440 [DPANN group archaeon]|nr:hypothetical protein [DPANN group archaeon]
MVLLDAYGQPIHDYSVMQVIHKNMYEQVSWEKAQEIVDKYKKQRAERMKQMTPMKTMKDRKNQGLENKL